MEPKGVTPTPPTVLIATEQESTVRIYAGHPHNGGVHQTGQFVTTRAIEPTDLANMVVDLSATFGWLDTNSLHMQPDEESVKALPQPETVRAIPSELSPTGTGTELIPCPIARCGSTIRSDNLPRHLMTSKPGHGLSQQAATLKARQARARYRATLAPSLQSESPKAPSHWGARVVCPFDGCGKESTRSNMTTHLQSKRHGVPRERANKMASELPALDGTVTKPTVTRANRAKRQGVMGARVLNDELLPKALEIIRSASVPISAYDVANAMHENPTTVRGWMNKLVERGEIRTTNPEGLPGVRNLFEPVPDTAPPVAVEEPTPQPVDSFAAPVYDVGSPTTPVEERNPQ